MDGESKSQIDVYLSGQLERENEEEENKEPSVSPTPQKNEDDGVDPMERGGEKAEGVPVPTDVDDEDMTLGDFFNKRTGARHDAVDATSPRGTQKGQEGRKIPVKRAVLAPLPAPRRVALNQPHPGKFRLPL